MYLCELVGSPVTVLKGREQVAALYAKGNIYSAQFFFGQFIARSNTNTVAVPIHAKLLSESGKESSLDTINVIEYNARGYLVVVCSVFCVWFRVFTQTIVLCVCVCAGRSKSGKCTSAVTLTKLLATCLPDDNHHHYEWKEINMALYHVRRAFADG